jgi:hypothetical protein
MGPMRGVDVLPGFEKFRAQFVGQGRSIDDGDDVRADDQVGALLLGEE